MMLTRRTARLNRGLIAVLAVLAFTLDATPRNARAQTPIVPRVRQAAFTLQGNRTYDFGGRVVRCRPDQLVGISAESSGYVAVTNVVIEGCQVGIVTSGPAARVFDVDVRDAVVCMFVSGSNGTISHNTISGCQYGIVVSGRENTVTDNATTDNAADGILITGDANLITSNRARRNGRVGIHVVRMVPMTAEGSFVPQIQDLATGNVLQRNDSGSNGVDLEEFGDCVTGLPNNWTDNAFTTKRPDCIE